MYVVIGLQESSPFVKNILLLDSEGKRIAVKYYDEEWASLSQQLAFEKSVFQKTQRANARGEAEIILFDDTIVVYKFINALHFFVTGSVDENEVRWTVLLTVLRNGLDGFYTCAHTVDPELCTHWIFRLHCHAIERGRAQDSTGEP